MTPGPVPIPLPRVVKTGDALETELQLRKDKAKQTWHLSKHVGQSAQCLSVQFHSVGYEGAFQEEVHPYPLRHGCRDENTQILQYPEQS